jgi:membrane protease YdiL (CAAX protease family)
MPAGSLTPWDVALGLALLVVVPALAYYNGRRMERGPPATLAPYYARMIVRGVLMACAVASLWHIEGRPFGQLGLDLPPGFLGRLGLAFAALLAVAAASVLAFLPRFIKPDRLPAMRAQALRMKILPRNGREMALFVAVALMAGFWEELLFRGFLIWLFIHFAPIWIAVLCSTAAFGIGHLYQGWSGLPRAGTIGLVLAVLYALTRSLWWIMALHAIVNLYGGIVSWQILRMPAPIGDRSK